MNNTWTKAGLLGAAVLMIVCRGVAAPAETEISSNAGLPEGYKVIEGDIVVPVDFSFEDRGGLGVQGVFATNWWAGGIVPYAFADDVTAANRTNAINAMAEWEAVANLDFVALTTQSDYIEFINSGSNRSAVGRSGGRQTIEIVSWGSRFIIAHEVGHALGLWHEQSRSDRDTYITVNLANIEDDKEHNFSRHDEADTYGGYDFDSVMHYGQCGFTICDCPAACTAITVNAPWHAEWQDAIGQRDHFSTLDILTIQMLYSEPGDTFVDKNYTGVTQNGSFLAPYKTFTAGASHVPPHGRVIIQPGTYTASAGVYTKAMTLCARGMLGSVLLK